MNELASRPAAVAHFTSARIAEIELLRALAILMVMVQHVTNLFFWSPRVADWTTGGWVGVDLFFAISGFVIARSLLPSLSGVEDPIGFIRIALEFWIRRAWRLLPSAWFWLVVPLILCQLFNRSGIYGSFQANWEMLVAGMLDIANFRTTYFFGRVGLGTGFVQWSLSLEEQFYLLLPIAVFFLRRRLPVALAIIALLGFVIPGGPFSNMLRLWPVAFGVLLAIWSTGPTYRDCAPSGLLHSRVGRIAMLVVPLACMVSLGVPSLHIIPNYLGPIALLAALLVWVASYDRGYLCQAGPFRRLMELIALRSYSLYLVHIPAYFTMHELWFRFYGLDNPTHSQAAVYAVIGLSLAAILTELSHRLIERPLRDRGKQIANAYAAKFRETAS